MSNFRAATRAAVFHPHALAGRFDKWLGAALLVLALLFAGTHAVLAHGFKLGDLKIEHPWSRAVPAGASVAGGYFTVINTGGSSDRLISITSDISAKAELHEMAVKDGVMTMRPVEGGLEVPAGKTVALEPGAYHLMFMGLKHAPKQGETFQATLTFEKAGAVTVDFAVEGLGETGGMKMEHEHAE